MDGWTDGRMDGGGRGGEGRRERARAKSPPSHRTGGGEGGDPGARDPRLIAGAIRRGFIEIRAEKTC